MYQSSIITLCDITSLPELHHHVFSIRNSKALRVIGSRLGAYVASSRPPHWSLANKVERLILYRVSSHRRASYQPPFIKRASPRIDEPPLRPSAASRRPSPPRSVSASRPSIGKYKISHQPGVWLPRIPNRRRRLSVSGLFVAPTVISPPQPPPLPSLLIWLKSRPVIEDSGKEQRGGILTRRPRGPWRHFLPDSPLQSCRLSRWQK